MHVSFGLFQAKAGGETSINFLKLSDFYYESLTSGRPFFLFLIGLKILLFTLGIEN